MWRCKKEGCKCEEFIAPAVEYHEWKVNMHGTFLEDVECKESDGPKSDDEVYCAECGTIAEWEDE